MGLSQEPFVSGIPEMIDTIVANIPNAEKGFRLLFASEPFPGYQVELEKVREEYDGVWYRWDDNGEGWLCPALLYFPEAPARLYAKTEALIVSLPFSLHQLDLIRSRCLTALVTIIVRSMVDRGSSTPIELANY